MDPTKVIKPKDLDIIWINDKRYWRKPENDEDVAELLQVCWLQVNGWVQADPKKKCQIGFQVSLTSDAFGWSGAPVYILAKRGKKGRYFAKKVNLADRQIPKQGELFNIPQTDRLELPPTENKTTTPPSNEPSPSSSDDDKIYFGLYEIWSGMWKGGLKIHNAFLKEI